MSSSRCRVSHASRVAFALCGRHRGGPGARTRSPAGRHSRRSCARVCCHGWSEVCTACCVRLWVCVSAARSTHPVLRVAAPVLAWRWTWPGFTSFTAPPRRPVLSSAAIHTPWSRHSPWKPSRRIALPTGRSSSAALRPPLVRSFPAHADECRARPSSCPSRTMLRRPRQVLPVPVAVARPALAVDPWQEPAWALGMAPACLRGSGLQPLWRAVQLVPSQFQRPPSRSQPRYAVVAGIDRRACPHL